MNIYNFDDIYYLIKNKNREHLTIKEEIDTIYYLVKKQKNQSFEDFCKIDLIADEVKKVKDNFFYCIRILADKSTEDFYLKKIEINKNGFINFVKNRVKDLNKLNFILKELEENEIYLIIADKVFDCENENLDNTIDFPFLLF